jgi:hypothetical protein
MMSLNGFIVVGGHSSPSVAGAVRAREIRCVGEENLTGGGATRTSTVAAEIPPMNQAAANQLPTRYPPVASDAGESIEEPLLT